MVKKKNLLPIWQEYVIENHLSIAKNREGLYYQELSLFSCGQEKRRRKNDMQNYSCQYPYVTSLCWSFPKASRNTKNAIAKHQSEFTLFNSIHIHKRVNFPEKMSRKKFCKNSEKLLLKETRDGIPYLRKHTLFDIFVSTFLRTRLGSLATSFV